MSEQERCIAQAEAIEQCIKDFTMKGPLKACMMLRAANLRQQAGQSGTLGRVASALIEAALP